MTTTAFAPGTLMAAEIAEQPDVWRRLLDEGSPAIRAAEIEMYPTSAGPYRSSLVQCNLDTVWMQRMTEHNARVCHGAVIPTRTIIEFLIDADQASIRHSGLEVTPGMVVVNDPSQTHRRSFGPCRFGTMSLANEQLDLLALSILGRELGGPAPSRARHRRSHRPGEPGPPRRRPRRRR